MHVMALVLAVMIITACTKSVANVNSSVNNEKSNSENSKAVTNDYESCLAGCELISTSGSVVASCKNNCETAKNFNSGNIADCENLSSSFRDACITNIAKENKNPSHCASVESSTLKATCYTTVARELNDPSVCDNITESIFKTSCLEKFE